MEINEILNCNSPEIKELFYKIEIINANMVNYIEQNKPSLLGEHFLDNNEVCEMLHVSTRTLQDYRDKGLIAFYKLEGKILYKLSDLKKLLEDNYFDSWQQI